MAKKKRRSKRIKPYKYGQHWDSKLELNHYEILLAHPLVTIVELQKEFSLMDGFDYIDFPSKRKRKFARMRYTCDFMIEIVGYDKPVVFESKGYPRKDYAIRKKIFINKYGSDYYFYECRSVKQLNEMLKGVESIE